MPTSSELKIRTLPETIADDAPSVYAQDLWFGAISDSGDFGSLRARIARDRQDERYMLALCAFAISERECPSLSDYAALVVAGGIIATLEGEYVMPPRSESKYYYSHKRNVLWGELYLAIARSSDMLECDFCACMLRLMLPYDSGDIRDPGKSSRFESEWDFYSETLGRSVSNMRLRKLREGQREFDSLPEEISRSIRIVTPHIQVMLGLVNQRIRETFRY